MFSEMQLAQLKKALALLAAFDAMVPAHKSNCAYKVTAREGTPGPCNCAWGDLRRQYAELLK